MTRSTWTDVGLRARRASTGALQALDTLGGFAWIGLYRPDEHELGLAAAEFDLHELAVRTRSRATNEPSWNGPRTPGSSCSAPPATSTPMRRSSSAKFTFSSVATSSSRSVTPNHLIFGACALASSAPDLLERGPLGVLYAIIDQVVDEYEPVVKGLQNDIDEIEFQLFSGDRAVTKRIYDLAGEVMELQRAIRPLTMILATLRDDLESENRDDSHALELRRSFRDVLDHVVIITEKAEEFRQTLSNALMTHTTLVAQQQNDEMKLLTETSLRQTEQAQEDLGVGSHHLRTVPRGGAATA